jgi:hypothetical protein
MTCALCADLLAPADNNAVNECKILVYFHNTPRVAERAGENSQENGLTFSQYCWKTRPKILN